jgi:hypothetical protein
VGRYALDVVSAQLYVLRSFQQDIERQPHPYDFASKSFLVLDYISVHLRKDMLLMHGCRFAMDTLTMCPMQDREISGRLHGYESSSYRGRCNVELAYN